MLNPDGVYYGRYRCNITGTDLNRIWNFPSKYFHPTIYFTKELLKQLHTGSFFKEVEDLNHSQQEIKNNIMMLELSNN